MNESKRYFIELSYRGTNFHGWQIQKNAYTVQECLENALSTYFSTPIAVMGSGRTDTGVHASMQVCHVDISVDFDKNKFLKSINAILPKDISIHWIRKVKPNTHARFHALERSYVYRIVFRKSPFYEELAWHYYFELNIEKMNLAAEALLRHENFESFSKIHTDVNHFRCKIKKAYWEQKDGELLFNITANRFLRGMVRTIVGTLLDVGLGRKTPADLDKIIESRKRINAGKASPAKGLFLSQVVYSSEIYLD